MSEAKTIKILEGTDLGPDLDLLAKEGVKLKDLLTMAIVQPKLLVHRKQCRTAQDAISFFNGGGGSSDIFIKLDLSIYKDSLKVDGSVYQIKYYLELLYKRDQFDSFDNAVSFKPMADAISVSTDIGFVDTLKFESGERDDLDQDAKETALLAEALALRVFPTILSSDYFGK